MMQQIFDKHDSVIHKNQIMTHQNKSNLNKCCISHDLNIILIHLKVHSFHKSEQSSDLWRYVVLSSLSKSYQFYSCFQTNLFHPIKNIQMLTEVEGNIDYID